MNSLIGCKELLAQLDTLKDAVRDFAAREQKLNATFQEQTIRETATFETRSQELATAISERGAAMTDELAAAK